jgi:drug/metabolite transporter (DMT)-like permease
MPDEGGIHRISSVLDRVPLSQANAFTLLTPVFALLLGIGFFGEPFGPSLAFGLVLTTIGLVIVERYGGS